MSCEGYGTAAHPSTTSSARVLNPLTDATAEARRAASGCLEVVRIDVVDEAPELVEQMLGALAGRDVGLR